MSNNDWKTMLYEPSEELIAVENVEYHGPEKVKYKDKTELITIENMDLVYSGKTGEIKALDKINFNIFPEIGRAHV